MIDEELPWSDPASDPMGDVLRWARRAYEAGVGAPFAEPLADWERQLICRQCGASCCGCEVPF